MGLLDKLFGSGKERRKPYVDAGVELTHRLLDCVGLGGWERDSRGLLLPVYTAKEMDAIGRRLSELQRMANSTAVGQARLHPEVADEIQRLFTSEALHNLAGCGWRYGFEKGAYQPEEWKDRLSTFLKAWACGLDPRVLLDVADLLAEAGYKREAKETLQVVLLFPSYGPSFSPDWPELAHRVVEDAQKALRSL